MLFENGRDCRSSAAETETELSHRALLITAIQDSDHMKCLKFRALYELLNFGTDRLKLWWCQDPKSSQRTGGFVMNHWSIIVPGLKLEPELLCVIKNIPWCFRLFTLRSTCYKSLALNFKNLNDLNLFQLIFLHWIQYTIFNI